MAGGFAFYAEGRGPAWGGTEEVSGLGGFALQEGAVCEELSRACDAQSREGVSLSEAVG